MSYLGTDGHLISDDEVRVSAIHRGKNMFFSLTLKILYSS